MDDKSRFVTGIDVGTGYVRAVVGAVNAEGAINIVGYKEVESAGMRRGIVTDLAGPALAMDRALKEAETMSGHPIDSAVVSVNGAHLLSTKTDGMVAVGGAEHEINVEDLARVEEMATTGKLPANRRILDLVPYSYALDGQGGIRDPLGMTGSRLEIQANVVSGLIPYCSSVEKVAQGAAVAVEKMIPSVMAGARAVLSEKQMENGVAVIDIGSATTSVAVYDNGDLQYIGVVEQGSNDITNDLATMLKTDIAVAEEVKRRFVTGAFDAGEKDIVVKRGRAEMVFKRKEVDEVAEARLDDMFSAVRKKLRDAGYDRRLPEGVVLVGGGARLRDIEVYAREKVELMARIGAPSGLSGLGDALEKSEWATAVGLMMAGVRMGGGSVAKKKQKGGGKGGILSAIKRFFSKF